MTLARAEDALQRRAVLFDKGGDRHYDYISAWIKATRGSDPDASLYYLAVMLEGGEDPRFIVRRMVILASEDIGNADPAALSLATAAAPAVEHVGLPEARYALAQAAIYLALAPKSDAAGRALAGAPRRTCASTARRRCRPGCAPGARPGQETGGYDYPHGRPGHLSAQELLPERRRRASASTSLTRPRRSSPSACGEIRRARGREASDNRPHMDALRRPASRSAPSERLLARDPATGAVLGSLDAHAAGGDRARWSRQSARCSRCGRCCGCRTAPRYMRRMAQAVIDDFDELQERLAREQGRPRAEIAALELLAAIDALIWIAEDGAERAGRAPGRYPAARCRSPSARASPMSHTASSG